MVYSLTWSLCHCLFVESTPVEVQLGHLVGRYYLVAFAVHFVICSSKSTAGVPTLEMFKTF